jgi:hypothetical protein
MVIVGETYHFFAKCFRHIYSSLKVESTGDDFPLCVRIFICRSVLPTSFCQLRVTDLILHVSC